MRAILIDPANRAVTEIQIEKGIDAIYEAIECETFSCPVEFDDEGLFKEQAGGIVMNSWEYPILGKILILGSDEEGESVDAKIDIEVLKADIQWIGRRGAEAWRSQFN